VADAMESVVGTERIASHDQTCVRDYSVACPLGDVCTVLCVGRCSNVVGNEKAGLILAMD
jgi:hypothetical protein